MVCIYCPTGWMILRGWYAYGTIPNWLKKLLWRQALITNNRSESLLSEGERTCWVAILAERKISLQKRDLPDSLIHCNTMWIIPIRLKRKGSNMDTITIWPWTEQQPGLQFVFTLRIWLFAAGEVSSSSFYRTGLTRNGLFLMNLTAMRLNKIY